MGCLMTVHTPGARNKKVARVAARLSPEIERRVEAVADKLGMNKGTTVAMLAAMGLAVFEQGLGITPPVTGREDATARILSTFDSLPDAQE